MTVVTDTTEARPHGPDGPRRLLPLYGSDSLDAHVALHGTPPYAAAPALTGVLAEAGLVGHGGAAFPVHRKWASVAGARRRGGRGPVVVANGAEGEPASSKDVTLLRRAPHLVLDGLQLAAAAVGAGEAHLVVEEGTGPAAGLRKALDRRARAGIDQLPVRLTQVPRRFLSGEASALAARLSGDRAALPAIPFRRCASAGSAGRRRWCRTWRRWPMWR